MASDQLTTLRFVPGRFRVPDRGQFVTEPITLRPELLPPSEQLAAVHVAPSVGEVVCDGRQSILHRLDLSLEGRHPVPLEVPVLRQVRRRRTPGLASHRFDLIFEVGHGHLLGRLDCLMEAPVG